MLWETELRRSLQLLFRYIYVIVAVVFSMKLEDLGLSCVHENCEKCGSRILFAVQSARMSDEIRFFTKVLVLCNLTTRAMRKFHFSRIQVPTCRIHGRVHSFVVIKCVFSERKS